MDQETFPREVIVSDEVALSQSSQNSPWFAYSLLSAESAPLMELPGFLAVEQAVLAAQGLNAAISKARRLGMEEGAESERERFAYPFAVMLSPLTSQLAAASNRKARDFDKLAGIFQGLVQQTGALS